MGFKVRSQGLATGQRSLGPRCVLCPRRFPLRVVCAQIYARPSKTDLKICGPLGWVISKGVEVGGVGFVLTLAGKHVQHRPQSTVGFLVARQ